MIKPGGTEGGFGKFMLGLVLAGASLYFLFDSVRVTTHGGGWISGGIRGLRGGGGNGGGGMRQTTSMGIVFFPFLIGLVALFYDASKKWSWSVMWVGLAIIVIEMFSRIRFLMEMKTSHLMIMLVTFAAGAGLMLQSYRDEKRGEKQRIKDEKDLGVGQGPGVEAGMAGSAERDEAPK